VNATPLPTRSEFVTRYRFDEQSTVEAFCGKTLEEARTLFQSNFLWYSEQLSVAAPVPFCFYILAATDYLRSVASNDDPDSINGFCGMVEHRLNHPSLGIPARAVPNIRDTIAVILDQFDRYDADVAIYGNLADRYRILANRLTA
jgi:hypothetical protein